MEGGKGGRMGRREGNRQAGIGGGREDVHYNLGSGSTHTNLIALNKGTVDSFNMTSVSWCGCGLNGGCPTSFPICSRYL